MSSPTTALPSAADLATVKEFNGPLLLAGMFYMLFYGIILGQAHDYYTWYNEDPIYLKALVAWQLLMGTAHGCIMFRTSWWHNIQGWGDMNYTYATEIGGNLMNVTTLFIIVPNQIFFAGVAYRALGKSKIYAGCIAPLIGIVLGSGLALCIELLWTKKEWMKLPVELPDIYLWSMATVEIVTAAVLLIRFKSLQKNAGEESKTMLNKVLFMILRTSLGTTAMCVWERTESSLNNMFGQLPGLILAGFAIISLLHTLNTRKALQSQSMSNNVTYGNTSGMGTKKWNTSQHRPTISSPAQEIRVETIVLQEYDHSEKNHDKDGDFVPLSSHHPSPAGHHHPFSKESYSVGDSV